MSSYSVGILTVSDRCSRGEATDTSGPGLRSALEGHKWSVDEYLIVPDELDEIQSVLKRWSDEKRLNLILTTGGTGMSPRDVTPEATRPLLDRFADGFVHAMMAGSLKVTPMAVLSRAVAGIRDATLIINLPGSAKASRECLGFILAALPHALDLISDKKDRVDKTHVKVQGCQHHSRSSIAARPRSSPYPMIEVSEAQKIVLETCSVLPDFDLVGIDDALDRILSEDVFARDDLPPFPASIKDGYAVVAEDGAGLRQVLPEGVSAGDAAPVEVKRGFCARINTGAPIPSGANAVVMVENTKLVKSEGGNELEIEILSAPKEGQDIRPIGFDISKGSRVLEQGCRISAAEIGLLATVGVTQDIKVRKLPRVSLLSTGNELQDPKSPLKNGCIRDSNKAMLKALLKDKAVIKDCGVASDDLATLKEKLALALDTDLLVTTGGVSMGDRDLLRQVLVEDFGAEIHFARVKMKPGKPTTFATLNFKGKMVRVLGLPGNPVSAFVTAHLYAVPACKKMAGLVNYLPTVVSATPAETLRLDPRPEYLRVNVRPAGKRLSAHPVTDNQASSRLLSCHGCNALLLLPSKSPEKEKVEAEVDTLEALIIGDF